ncbi:MAG: hypothetical protein AB8I69_09680, partial [Anaerolineae bacterium]
MFTKRLFTIVLIGGVLMLAAENGTTFALSKIEKPDPPGKAGATQLTNAQAAPAAMQAPPLTDFIDIKVDDVNNYNPAVAYNSRHDEYLVVWENDRGATRDIYAQRVAGDGTLKTWFTIAH